MKKYIFLTTLFVLLFGAAYFGMPAFAWGTTQVRICHATGSNTNPFNSITVDWNAVDGEGNSDHNRSGHQNGEDIIPPGFWDWNGRNWNTAGQAIWNNDCNVPQPSPTPIPPTSTPEPTEVPLSPTPTIVEPSPTPVEPSPTPEVSPTPKPECENDCATPTPSPRPTEIPQPTETPFPQSCRGCDEKPSAPMCPNSDTTVAAQNFHILRNGSQAIAKWVPTAGNQVNLYYREVGQTAWTHSVRDEANDGYLEIGYLNPSLGYEFGLQQKADCGGGPVTAVVIDPPVTKWTLFRVSYYQ